MHRFQIPTLSKSTHIIIRHLQYQSNPYKVLEIPTSATQSEIKKAYIRMVFDHHPDRNKNSTKFPHIASAYKLLSNPFDKREYDTHSQQSNNGRPSAHYQS